MADKAFSTQVIQKISRLKIKISSPPATICMPISFSKRNLYHGADDSDRAAANERDRTAALNANPNDFIDNRYAQILDQRGLYAELDRTFKPR